jgi:hypothetical protein
MPPSKQTCEIFLSAESEKAKLLIQYQNAISILSQARKLYQDILFGKINPNDKTHKTTSIQDIANQAEKAATDISNNIVGDLSKSGKDLLKVIFLQIIKVLLSTPESIFSLVFIPKDQAETYCNNERKYLLKAKDDIDFILQIISRWQNKSVDSNLYYNSILRALPYIREALAIIHQVGINLNNTDNTSFQNALAFDESKYNRIKFDISQALDILKTSPNAQTPIDIANTAAADSDSIYQASIKSINAKYKTDKQTLSDVYLAKLTISKKNPSINTSDIKQQYASDLKKLDDNLKHDLNRARADSLKKATMDIGGNYRKMLVATGTEFVYDIQSLTTHLLSLSLNLQTAFSFYTKKQVMCNTIYNMDANIKNLVNEVMNYLKPNPTPIDDVSGAENFLSIANDKATDAVNRFNKSDQKMSSSQISESKFSINMFLNLTNQALNISINGKLKSILDTALVLQDASGNYNRFLKAIAGIPDWDGARNVWAVKPSFAAPPYIQAVADSLDMAVKIPLVFNTFDNKSRNSIGTLASTIKRDIEKHLQHNNYVEQVLYSYNPKVHTELSGLFNALSKSGLLPVFSQAMSIVAVVNAVNSNISVRSLGNSFPNFDSCQIYPELYKDNNLSLSAVKNNLDSPSYGTNTSTMDMLASTALKTNAVRADVRAYSLQP